MWILGPSGTSEHALRQNVLTSAYICVGSWKCSNWRCELIVLFIRVDVKEGREGEFQDLVGQLSAASLENEPGCLQYDLCKTTVHENYVILEKYESQEALDEHRQATYFKELGGLLRDCIQNTQRHEMRVIV